MFCLISKPFARCRPRAIANISFDNNKNYQILPIAEAKVRSTRESNLNRVSVRGVER